MIQEHLSRYLRKEGHKLIGDPHYEFVDVPGGEVKSFSRSTVSWLGHMVLNRVNNGRWFVQWWSRDKKSFSCDDLLRALDAAIEERVA